MSTDETPVRLYIYDLSNGQAKKMSLQFLGIQVDGIWHTSVVAYGREHYFQRQILSVPIGSHDYGAPVQILEMGNTHVPEEIFITYLEELSEKYNQNTYDLMRNNCNHFSNDAVNLLLSKNIPAYILNLPDAVMNTPMYQLILKMFKNDKNL